MIKVWKTQLSGSPTCVHVAQEAVELEISSILDEMGVSSSFTITVAEMTEEEFDALEEFQGY